MADVSLASVDKFYGDQQALRSVSLDIRDGEFAVFVGPSGCGKSTLLRAIAGLEGIGGGSIERSTAPTSRASRRPSATWRWCSRPTRSTRT